MLTGRATSRGLVIDASVAVKWFSRESESDLAKHAIKAARVAGRFVYIPELLIYEVGNALWRGKRLEERLISKALNDLLDMELQFVSLNPALIKYSASFMTRYDLSFYDAVYGGLAFLLKVPLLTANPKHHGRVKEIEIIELKALKF